MRWIILVGVGVVIAVAIGLVANSQSVAEDRFCDDLSSLGSSITNLTSLNPKGATQGDFQSGCRRCKARGATSRAAPST
jgi:hypothetical protein